MADLQSRSLLTPGDERRLWEKLVTQGDLTARQTIIEHYQPLVFKIASAFGLQSAWVFDLLQEGTVGLIEAVEKFDPSRGVAFSLFAYHRIRGRMLNYLKKEYPAAELEELGEDLRDETASTVEQVEQIYLLEQVQLALGRLPPKEQQVLHAVYLREQEPKALAEEMEISVSYLYRLQKQGLRRVRGMLSKLMHHW